MFLSEVSVVNRMGREHERLPVDMRARYGGGGPPTRALCRIVDLSKRGARLEVYCDLERDAIITLSLPTGDVVRARVIWAKDFEAGCRFMTPLAEGQLDIILRQGHA
jgi:hypothetical protein